MAEPFGGGALELKEVPKRLLILGGGMVGTHAGDMIGEIALAIEKQRSRQPANVRGYFIDSAR